MHIDSKYKIKYMDIKIKGYSKNEQSRGSNLDPLKNNNKNNIKNTIYINESGLYQLIATCKTNSEIANNFKTWLYEEVIPTIRKAGGYFKYRRKSIMYIHFFYFHIF